MPESTALRTSRDKAKERMRRFSLLQKIGHKIQDNDNWKCDESIFSSITKELADEIFCDMMSQSFNERIKMHTTSGLINLFYALVALENKFDLRYGSATPIPRIMYELGSRDKTYFETLGNWAGENRGLNAYTPFGRRRGFETYQELLDHDQSVIEKQIEEKRTANERREQIKIKKASNHQKKLREKKARDARIAMLAVQYKLTNLNG